MKKTQTKLPSGLHALVWREGKWYVAKCIEVEVASQGETKNAALKNLTEALELYFEETPPIKPPLYQHVELHTVPLKYA